MTATCVDGGLDSEAVRIVFVSWRDLSHPQAGGSEVLIDRLASGVATTIGRFLDVCAEIAPSAA